MPVDIETIEVILNNTKWEDFLHWLINKLIKIRCQYYLSDRCYCVIAEYYPINGNEYRIPNIHYEFRGNENLSFLAVAITFEKNHFAELKPLLVIMSEDWLETNSVLFPIINTT